MGRRRPGKLTGLARDDSVRFVRAGGAHEVQLALDDDVERRSLTKACSKVKYQQIESVGKVSGGCVVDQPSSWAVARFGGLAPVMGKALAQAMRQAHEDAVAAHVAGGMKANDTYGNTMFVRSNEEVLALAKKIPGLMTQRPEGIKSRFQLLIVEETKVAVYPWRFGDSAKVRHSAAQLRRPVSDLRAVTFSLSATSDMTQPTLMDTNAPIEELEARWAEEDELRQGLSKLGAAVVVGITSAPNGIFELGWGDVALDDRETGEVTWPHWESLSVAAGADVDSRRPVLQDASRSRPRFDDVAVDDDLDLTPRRDQAPVSEPALPQPDTGTTADNGD